MSQFQTLDDLRANLEAMLLSILKQLVCVQIFLAHYAKETHAPLAVVEEKGYRLALTLVPEQTKVPLTPRQGDIARLVGYGDGNRGIAKKLGISEQTVKTQLKHIYERWHLRSRAELARCAAVLLS